MRTILVILASAVLAATAQASGQAGDYTATTPETVRVWTVDTRGKPPYKRRVEELPVTDLAAKETGETGDSDTPVKGRPPYQR